MWGLAIGWQLIVESLLTGSEPILGQTAASHLRQPQGSSDSLGLEAAVSKIGGRHGLPPGHNEMLASSIEC